MTVNDDRPITKKDLIEFEQRLCESIEPRFAKPGESFVETVSKLPRDFEARMIAAFESYDH